MTDLKLIVLDSMQEMGEKVNAHLKKMCKTKEDFIVPVVVSKFNNGEGKVKISESIRNKDVYILSDVGNHSITYKMYDYINHKSPDDHYQDIKRVIYAVRDHSKCNSIIMPLLYASRQHRRAGRESLDCAASLQELVGLKVKNIVTFDLHDADIQNAIPNSSFENFYPTKEIIESFLNNEDIDFQNIFVIAPDTGAIGRANLYANLFKCNMGFFRKERDTSVLVDGKNPIIDHQYVGPKFKGKNVIIVDDMIASGDSISDVSKVARELGANKIYLTATFALFTKGIEEIQKAYDDKQFDKIYTTNLTYQNPEYAKLPWLEVVDCSCKIAKVICHLNQGKSLSPLLNESAEITEMITKKITEKAE
ncbi:MAG: ribose-phosphate diphosphokinase [Bacilli bacterium]|nr:ribose-phosphate diphosphokinase [Bacilli bacterium]